MICHHCGKTIPSSASFCAYCGERSHLAAATAPSSSTSAIDADVLQQRRSGLPIWAKWGVAVVLVVLVAIAGWLLLGYRGLEVQVPQQIVVGDKLTISVKGTNSPVMLLIRNTAGTIVAKRQVDDPQGEIEVPFDTNSWIPDNHTIEVCRWEAVKTKAKIYNTIHFVITGIAEKPIYDAHFSVTIHQPMGGPFELEWTADILEGPFEYRGRGATGWGVVGRISRLKARAHGFRLVELIPLEVTSPLGR